MGVDIWLIGSQKKSGHELGCDRLNRNNLSNTPVKLVAVLLNAWVPGRGRVRTGDVDALGHQRLTAALVALGDGGVKTIENTEELMEGIVDVAEIIKEDGSLAGVTFPPVAVAGGSDVEIGFDVVDRAGLVSPRRAVDDVDIRLTVSLATGKVSNLEFLNGTRVSVVSRREIDGDIVGSRSCSDKIVDDSKVLISASLRALSGGLTLFSMVTVNASIELLSVNDGLGLSSSASLEVSSCPLVGELFEGGEANRLGEFHVALVVRGTLSADLGLPDAVRDGFEIPLQRDSGIVNGEDVIARGHGEK